ncbi:hypothetical protein ACFE04_008173 [Oxalis oulophora]
MEWMKKKKKRIGVMDCLFFNEKKPIDSRNTSSSSTGLQVEADSGGGEDMFADPPTQPPPRHLVVMVNGLVGSPDDWRYAAQQFVKRLPDKVIVHRSQCNCSKLTFDGVDLTGERLAKEVLSVIENRPELRKISFVAHSLGGLIARYAIGRLYDHSLKLETSKLAQDAPTADQQVNHQPHVDKIAGLEPMNFITVATPHLGSRGHKQLPLLCGLPFLEKRAMQTAHWIAGRTGKHLFLTDNEDGKPPLLIRMASDSYDLKFISALNAFKRRVAYANANFDSMVGWRTSSIRRQNELPICNLRVTNEKYPHVVCVESETVKVIHNKGPHDKQTIDLEEEMIRGLTEVPWERVHVSFQKSTQRYGAHNTIQASLQEIIAVVTLGAIGSIQMVPMWSFI